MNLAAGTEGQLPIGEGPAVEPDVEITVRSGVSGLATYVEEHRVAVDDGTRGSKQVGWILLIGFVLAALTLLVSNLAFGPRDTFLPDSSSGKQIPAIVVVASLVLIAVFLAVGAWHSVTASAGIGRTFIGPISLTTLVVVVANAFIGLSLLSTAALLRTRAGVFAQQPSLVNVPLGDSDTCLALGLIVLVACLLLLGVSLIAPHQRALATTLAAAPALACAVGYVIADRNALALSDWAASNINKLESPAQAAYLLASPSAQIATAPLLVLVLASTAGIGLLVAFGTVEFVDAKAKLGRWLTADREVPVGILAAAVGAVALALIAGRFGWLPDGKGAAQSFYKEAIDSWAIAALLGAGGLWALHTSRRRPLEQRNPRTVIAIACVALVAGQIVLFLSLLLQQISDPFVSRDTTIGHFVFERFPTWALWSQSWVTIIVAAGLGVWGLYRLLARHERSDRVVFAIAFGVVTFQLQLQIILSDHWANKDLPSFTAATPDQIALCVTALIAIAALVRRPILDTRSATLVVLVVFLVTLADAVIPNWFSANVFQLLLIAPFAYRFLFDSEETHRDPRKGAITVAMFGLLFIAESVAIAVGGLDSDTFESSEVSAFIQLTAPLALLVLCATAAKAVAPVAPVAEPVPATTSRRSWKPPLAIATTVATAAILLAALVFTVIRLPNKNERGTYRIDLATLPATYNPTQVLASPDAEQVVLVTDDLGSILVIHDGLTDGQATLAEPCSDTGIMTRLPAVPTSPAIPAGTIDGIPAQSMKATVQTNGQTANYFVTCASAADAKGVVRVVFVAERDATGLSSDANAIIDGLRFSASPTH